MHSGNEPERRRHPDSEEIRERRRQQRQDWDALHNGDGKRDGLPENETRDDVTVCENPTAMTAPRDAPSSRSSSS